MAGKRDREKDGEKKVIFGDKSRFSLDGPDGLSAYWSDWSRYCGYNYTSQRGVGSLTILVEFSARGKSKLAFILEIFYSYR